MDPQLRAQLRETINVASPSSVDSAGDASYGVAVPYAARIVNEQSTVEAADGTEYKTTITFVTEGTIELADRVWLPGDSPANPALARVPRYVEKAVDERGSFDFYRVKL